MNEVDLAAFSVARRAVCISLFRQLDIEDVLIRQLPANERRAVDSVVGFLNQILEENRVAQFAFALPSDAGSERHRRILMNAIELVRRRGIPRIEIPASDLLVAYGYPPLTRREQLRNVGRSIWPALHSRAATRLPIDAALLGLHVQTERLIAREEAA